MNKLLLNTKIKILIFFLLISFSSFGKDVARIIDLKGNAFSFNKSGHASQVYNGQHLKDLTELMVEDGSQITIINFYEHTFHISGGSHIRFMNKIIEVKSGQIWVHSENEKHQFSIQTANAVSEFNKAEFILSYNNNEGHSQLLVLGGNVNFYNAIENHLKYTVPAGKFSIISKNYSNGMPRRPTLVGFNSFENIISSFDGVSPQDHSISKMIKTQTFEKSKNKLKRSIASTSEEELPIGNNSEEKYPDGKIIYYKTYESSIDRDIASSNTPSVMKYYQKKKDEEHKRKMANRPRYIKVRKFSLPEKSKVKMEQKRLPASVIESRKLIYEIENDFEKTLVDEFAKQKRHPNEVNQLINDLQSLNKDLDLQY